MRVMTMKGRSNDPKANLINSHEKYDPHDPNPNPRIREGKGARKMQAAKNSELNSDYESNQGCHSDVRVSHPTYSDNNPNPTLKHCHTGLYSAESLNTDTAACDSARVVSDGNDSANSGDRVTKGRHGNGKVKGPSHSAADPDPPYEHCHTGHDSTVPQPDPYNHHSLTCDLGGHKGHENPTPIAQVATSDGADAVLDTGATADCMGRVRCKGAKNIKTLPKPIKLGTAGKFWPVVGWPWAPRG